MTSLLFCSFCLGLAFSAIIDGLLKLINGIKKREENLKNEKEI